METLPNAFCPKNTTPCMLHLFPKTLASDHQSQEFLIPKTILHLMMITLKVVFKISSSAEREKTTDLEKVEERREEIEDGAVACVVLQVDLKSERRMLVGR